MDMPAPSKTRAPADAIGLFCLSLAVGDKTHDTGASCPPLNVTRNCYYHATYEIMQQIAPLPREPPYTLGYTRNLNSLSDFEI